MEDVKLKEERPFDVVDNVILNTTDKAIEVGFKKLGYRLWASGYDFIGHVRDLAFERRGK